MEEYFSFLLKTLYLTEKAVRKDDESALLSVLKKLKCVFEIKTVCIMGVMPELERCLCCGNHKKINYFSCEEGGAVCDDCIGRYSGREKLPVSINDMDVKIINYIINCDNRSVFSFSISDELLNRICNISEKYLIAQTETFYKSLVFLHKMISESV